VPHRLAQTANLGWCDSGLREPAHPQQIGQIGGVAFVFSELKTILGFGA
jgi:hypothetical protein